MARISRTIAQNYPRVQDENNADYGCLDETALVSHVTKISEEHLKTLINSAIIYAEKKSSRESLSLPEGASETEINALCEKEGKSLFKHFKKYVGDPAASAHTINGKHYRAVGLELFRTRALQKGRMNSGWRYQALAIATARKTGRFISISDLAAGQGDFNAVMLALLDAFGEHCREADLLNEQGNFNNPHKLLNFLIGSAPKTTRFSLSPPHH